MQNPKANWLTLAFSTTAFVFMVIQGPSISRGEDPIQLRLRVQEPTSEGSSRYHSIERGQSWSPQATAVIVCDMWDSHHCVNAVRRVTELAPRMNQFVSRMRDRGATIIHAPSSCMEAYKDHPSRIRAQSIPMATRFPTDIANWCDQIPSEEAAAYPVDQSEGGEDDDPLDHQQWAARLESIGRNPKAPWLKQCDAIQIDAKVDYISDSGQEIWSLLENNKISNVMLVGVHTNMCVLGRPFGLRRMASNGKNTVLVRDLTDTMYDPNAWPYVNHFSGTDLIVQHIERYVCPTITSNQVLGGSEFRFSGDRRPRLAILIAEDEYKTESTLPKFAAQHLAQSFSTRVIYGSDTDRSHIPSLEQIDDADALLISVRRRPLPPDDIERIRRFVANGKPLIGIRTASHAFSLRDQRPSSGLADWPEFDQVAWGGNYTNHFGNDLSPRIHLAPGAEKHTIVAGNDFGNFVSGGSLYKTAPLGPGTHVLLTGSIEGQPAQPIAWTLIRNDGGRSFYTSLGHEKDFQQTAFVALLSAGVHWACNLPTPSLESVRTQSDRVANGKGRQRK